MWSRLVSGELHPFIHLSYGIEFQFPMIVSEALAQTAVHENTLGAVINEKYWTPCEQENLCHDNTWSNTKWQKYWWNSELRTRPKTRNTTRAKADVSADYAGSWVVKETEESLKEKRRNLYEGIVLIYAASAQCSDKQTQKLDFLLMHGSTSVYFVNIFMNYFSTKQRVMLLKAVP